MWDYNNKVMDYFLNPRNVGEIPDADAEAEVGNMTCGDALRIFLKIDESTHKIVDAKFKTFGCVQASQMALVVKNSPANAGDAGSVSESGKIPWRRKWQTTPVFLPGESHGGAW